MKIINCCINDWANFQHENAIALRSVGVDCEDYKILPHQFNYASQSVILGMSDLLRKLKQADIIQIFHTENEIFDLLKKINLTKKKIVVYHTGSKYRANPDKYNRIFNHGVFKTFTDQCEFFKLGAKNINYIATAIDVKKLNKFGHEVQKPYKIGHFPSNKEVKGTEKILEMLSRCNEHILSHSSSFVSHTEQYKRMNDCDIYIELFKPELRGKPYGCFGVTAFEASASGKVVVTQNINQNVYTDTYGECPFVICNTEEEFINNVNSVLALPKIELAQLQTKTYEWVNRVHSYQATGKYLKSKLEI